MKGRVMRYYRYWLRLKCEKKASAVTFELVNDETSGSREASEENDVRESDPPEGFNNSSGAITPTL